jgi:hypothetical protein
VAEPGITGNRAVLKLAVPVTGLFGRVLGENGEPAVGAEVWVEAQGHSLRMPVSADGSFERRGLPSGRACIHAERFGGSQSEPSTSEAQVIELAEDQWFGPLELRLGRLTQTRGRVLAASGRPLAGAVVALQSRALDGFGAQATSDAEGYFSVRTDPRVKAWTVAILGPGAPLTVFEHPNDGAPLEFRLDDEEGELVLELPVNGADLEKDHYGLRVFREGVEFGAPWLFQWRSALGLPTDSSLGDGFLAVPKLATGQYTACFGPREKVLSQPLGLEAPSNSAATCRTGYLSGGGRLKLSLPLTAR